MERQKIKEPLSPLQKHPEQGSSELIRRYFQDKYIPYVFLLDQQLNIHYCNLSEGQSFFNRPVNGLRHLDQLFDPQDLALIGKHVAGVLENKKMVLLPDRQLFNKTEPVHLWLRFELFPEHLLSADGALLVELCIPAVTAPAVPAADPQHFQLLEEENEALRSDKRRLEKTNEYLDSFVTGAAHDLRSPLVVLKSYVDLIKRMKDEDRKLKALENMKLATIRFENIVKGLVDSVECQKRGLCNAEEIRFGKLFELTLFQLSTEIKEAEPEIETDFSEAPSIFFIKSFLNSIFYNIVSNAIKYRDQDRRLQLKISSFRKEGFVGLSFIDNGIGIDLEQFSKQLFQPFQRLTAQASGLGIGLSLINRMVEENGGYIEVDSQLGQGTRFSIFLKPYNGLAAVHQATN